MSFSETDLEGFGLGLRPQHFPDIINCRNGRWPGVDWLELISENFIGVGGLPMRNLMQVREHYPLAMHGVSLSIGGLDPIDVAYLRGLKNLSRAVEPAIISDHLCWTGVNGINLHDLLPLPLTEEALNHVAARICFVQETLQRRIAIENPSTYVGFADDGMTEWEFLTELTRRTDCDLLLDVNNVYVSAFNHGFEPAAYLTGIPLEKVCQIHLAGHTDNGDHLIDTHDSAVIDPVWSLFRQAIARFGGVPTMIERDANIPPFAELVEELQHARRLAGQALRSVAA